MAAEGVKTVNVGRGAVASNMYSAQQQMPPPSSHGRAATRVGTTTRSGRRSVPVLAFWRTGGRETDASSSLLTEYSSQQHRVTSKSHSASKKSAAAQTSKSTSCHEGTGFVAAGLFTGRPSNRVNSAISSQERKAAERVDVDVRQGAAPVLDWWRNQRSTNAADGAVEAAPPPKHQDRLYPRKPTDVGDCGACSSSPEVKTADHACGSGEAQWTEGQLHSLHVAQADTDPSTSDFWGAVAGRVEGRNSQQCQQKWFEHIATPRSRPRKGSQRSVSSLKPRTAVSATPTNQEGEPADIDDVFQATPMRERRRVGAQFRTDKAEPKTPKTPVGPGARHDGISAAKVLPGDGCASHKRVVSRAYVQAMSKKIRKGASQSARSSLAAGGKESAQAQCGVAGRCRTIQAADVSRGRRLKASVSTSGTVCVASTCSSDEDSFGLSDDQESDDE